MIVGYGINGCQTEAELPTSEATSLRLLTGTAPDLSRLGPDLAAAVLDGLTDSGPGALLVETYAGRSAHRPGDRLSCRQGDRDVDGRFTGFDELGRLCLETDDGQRVLGSAEVVIARDAGHEPGTGACPDRS